MYICVTCMHVYEYIVDGVTGVDLFRQYLTILSQEYVSVNRDTVTFYANTLLLSLFGIDVSDNSNRGISSIQEYGQWCN